MDGGGEEGKKEGEGKTSISENFELTSEICVTLQIYK